MNKILLIIQREYLSRVKKKSFIVMTLLVPVLFIGMFVLIGYLAAKQGELGDTRKVEVIDQSGFFKNTLKSKGNIEYTFATKGFSEAKDSLAASGFNYLVLIPASMDSVWVWSDKKQNLIVTSTIQEQLNAVAQSHRLVQSGIDTALLSKMRQPLNIATRQLSEKGDADVMTGVAYGVGFFTAFLIYMSLFIYGAQVMRGVIEEKTSRIIEVIISSVRPFQLMMGKIIGVGLVGLTQFLLWIIITIVLSGSAGTLLASNGAFKSQVTQSAVSQHAAGAAVAPQQPDDMAKIMTAIHGIPVGYTVGCFLFYFLFGYFLYSAIFAAVGSAVDSETETQQFMLPITLPLVFTIIISMNYVIYNPDSTLSVALSLIPFTSPIAMMVRLPLGVPGWQLALSMALMIIGFLFTTWVAARIYRVGILMYGKKASYKELAKWFMYKG